MTKSEKTRRFIIEQSAVIFNKKGIAGTSITDLMNNMKYEGHPLLWHLILFLQLENEIDEFEYQKVLEVLFLFSILLLIVH